VILSTNKRGQINVVLSGKECLVPDSCRATETNGNRLSAIDSIENN